MVTMIPRTMPSITDLVPTSSITSALAPRKAFTPDNTVTLYEKKGTIPMSSSDIEIRDLSLDSAIHRR
ncbi:hypothetical protein N7457_009482 [Penicillium paradoxum]|uniref:uncharacterized protein n=1 Tax=Penicillium paradoxum TaxID=176176 RepID=UPI0025479EF4|nr:uncharacterized protein N7457_009482 [Penicillium paradoxum]KAJ5774586.1 hypothetical protein N7457_009482 [Penicillium paradoxum]